MVLLDSCAMEFMPKVVLYLHSCCKSIITSAWVHLTPDVEVVVVVVVVVVNKSEGFLEGP